MHPSRATFYALFTVSGFAGLIYESIWTHYLKLFLGHAAYAQSLVLVVFMGGMALGSAWCGRRSARIAHPLAAYALVELLVGICALGFHELFVAVTGLAHDTVLPALAGGGLALGAKLAISCLLILPQSVLLGATFPLMSAGLVRAHPVAPGNSVAMLYFTNSLGAVIGVLASGFLLIGWVGLPGTLRVAGAVNLALAASVWWLARPLPRLPRGPGAGDAPRAAVPLLAVAFLTGLASFIYEVGWIRMLSLVLGASTHAFELMLATFILGLALGGLAIRNRVDATSNPRRTLGIVQLAMGLLAVGTLPVYDQAFEVMERLLHALARTGPGYLLFNLAGQGIAAAVMLPATFCAGMTLPLITATLMREGSGEAAIGQVYAANTLGAIAGVVIAVHVALPLLGLKGAVLLGGAVDVALGWALLGGPGPTRHAPRAWLAAGLCLPFLALGLGFELDPHKLTSGVYRHGDLASSRDTRILYARDGKTATVHLVEYPDALSLRTNGKSDGSIAKPGMERGSDEITMVLTGALPLALRPDARTAAVIGIGTGLTTHTLLQSLTLARVETVEIERGMAEAARLLSPRNSAAFADPRSEIRIDDAKTYFSTRNRRYDIIISEPSNPWVSGVSSLFTREFYGRVRNHLTPGGLLVQWFQLYEIAPARVASVMVALGEVFPHYAVFAPSDHDLLIVASDTPVPLPAQAGVFGQPGLAAELFKVHVLTPGDIDARYLGERRTLEPLFLSYGVPANSDYAPLLDLHAAEDRFVERSASDIVELLSQPVPLLELLDRNRTSRPLNPLGRGAYAFRPVDHARIARYALAFLLDEVPPVPDTIGTTLQKDLELVRLRLFDCRSPRDLDAWLHALLNVARSVNPYTPAEQASRLWQRIAALPCHAELHAFQRMWIALFAAVGMRDATAMAASAASLLESQHRLGSGALDYLLQAAMAGNIARGAPEAARALWTAHAERLDARQRNTPAIRLLRCRAMPPPDQGCLDPD